MYAERSGIVSPLAGLDDRVRVTVFKMHGKATVPFQLESGIYLENIQTLVPWGAAICELQRYGSAVVTWKPSGIWVDWRGIECLGGIRCGASACQLLGPVTPNAYRVFLPELHWAQLIVAPGRPLAGGLLWRTFCHLKEHFGQPHSFYADYYAGMPWVWWRFDRLHVSVGPEYGIDRVSIEISHEPPGFEDFKRQAAEWEAEHGDGGREDYKEELCFGPTLWA